MANKKNIYTVYIGEVWDHQDKKIEYGHGCKNNIFSFGNKSIFDLPTIRCLFIYIFPISKHTQLKI